MDWKVAFFETGREEKAFLKKVLKGLETRFFHKPLAEEDITEVTDSQILSVFLRSEITTEVLDRFPSLRLVATRTTGFNHIDLEACRRRGVKVANVPLYGENTVAEHTFALILSLSRNVHRAYMRTIRDNFSLDGLIGFDLKDKTIGIIGAGRIGLHVIKMAKGFGMKALAYDIKRDPFLAEVLGFSYVSMEELLSQSHVISLHAPLVKQTHHMINRDNIHLIRRGALLVNTARGELVETEALLEALDQGILAGAGLDVLEGEEFIMEDQQLSRRTYTNEMLKTNLQNHLLLHREDVVITPHIGFFSREATQRILATTSENIMSFIQGKEINMVT